MSPPPALVRSVRAFWHWQWLQLMGGLAPADRAGHYRRPEGAYIALPTVPQDAAEPGAYALIVGRSCPWAHRAWLVWALRGLEDSLSLLKVEPDPEAGRWCFPEPFLGCSTLADLYRRSGGNHQARATVPLVVEQATGRILVNESARVIELLNRWPAQASAPNLEPPAEQEAIGHWRGLFQEAVNDGVYRCGFARTQQAYDADQSALFAALEAADQALQQKETAGHHWLCSADVPTLADVVLFPTLIRWEMVYAPLFGCSQRPLWQLPALWRWRARFFALPGVAATCFADQWRQDYFGALFPLHPSGLIPAGPDLATLVNSTPPSPP
ncbi:MAG: glutathione S-transferase C-terminal domain-containing protein [Cyanobacteriota bacterium]|nr:glutathione S-transferase C-terminal domain-containing protein [Cyanobacteriota bacterium]